MFGYPTPVVLFTLIALVAWGSALLWARSQPKDTRWYHYWLLGLTTVFWWVAESIAIRLGKYQYHEAFRLRLSLPWGGTPDNPGRLTEMLRGLLPKDDPKPWLECTANTFAIPIPVVLLEAALLFGLFHLSVHLFKSGPGSRVRAAFATAGLCGLLLVNITAILDPAVSINRWCHAPLPDPGYHFLSFGLWEWFTTAKHPGYWFGVPPVNYATWFVAAAVFAFLARLDDERPGGLIKPYKAVALYLLVSVAAIGAVFLLLIPVKIAVDRLLGLQLLFDESGWQFTVVLILLLSGLVAALFGRRQPDLHFEVVTSVPKILTLAFCLGLLVIQPHGGIFVVWFAAAVIAAIVLLWPFVERIAGKRRSRVDMPSQKSKGDFTTGD